MKNYPTHNSLLPFYLSNQRGDSTNTYNLCFSYNIDNSEHIDSIIVALQKLITLQAHLRQTFHLKNNTLMAKIHPTLPAKISHISTTSLELDKIEKTLIHEHHTISDTSSIILNVITLEDCHTYIALFNIHHILMDGHSLEEFIDNLNLLLADKPVVEIGDITHINQLKNEPPLLTYNKGSFDPIPSYTKSIEEIASNTPYFKAQPHDVYHYIEILPTPIYQNLIQASKKRGLSIFNILLLAWAIFIAKINNQKSAIVNYPVNIRTQKSISGCFINPIYLPLTFSPIDSYLTVINKHKHKMSFFKQLAKLQATFGVESISSFAQSNFAKPKDLIINNQTFKSKGFSQIAHSTLSVKYKEYQDSIFFSIDIASGLFAQETQSTLLFRFFCFLSKLLINQNKPLTHIDLIFEEEKTRILSEFNQTSRPFPQNKTLIDLFERQAQLTPHRIALVFENHKLSYAELNEKSNQLARFILKSRPIKPDDLIVLLLDRNEYTILSILAVLKTGGAYVPVDLSYPTERINFILEDTQANLILINQTHQVKLTHLLNNNKFKSTLNVIVIDSDETKNEILNFEKNDLINASTNTNLAYIIYTSGTTGRPKGVMIEHKSVVNTITALITDVYEQPLKKTKVPLKITAFTSYSFDVSVAEFFVPMLTGNELHLLSNTLRKDLILTSQYINNHKIDYIYLPPVLLANLPRIKYPSLIGIIYAGEPCDKETADYWSKEIKLFNYYGPTEASIYATGLLLHGNEVELIGKPIQNTTAYILTDEKIPQPIGIMGELYIGGIGLARGYLNQQTLTSEKFIINPFQSIKEKMQGSNALLYKTGDLARWNPHGNIEYLGRNDFQIKIRGHRIEIGEIETTLLKYPNIRQALVLLKDSIDTENSNITHPYLVGYYVSEKKIDELLIQEYLSLHLPDFMMPDSLIHLTHFPTNQNGKINRADLPTPELGNNQNYVPPTNKKEKLICDAFSKVLSLDKIGIYDDFFKVGGNSIRAISLISILQKNFNINVADIYTLKTPKKIVDLIPFSKNNLKRNLQIISKSYQTKNSHEQYSNRFRAKIKNYMSGINKIKIEHKMISMNTILLTGATGFLGCNLLNSILHTTDYTVFLIIRADNDKEAYERVNNKFKYYFERSLNHFYNIRLFVYAGDIEKDNLGVSKTKYHTLINQIDSIIHSAALTKHYGNYDTFYSANVQSTINLLNLSNLTKLKNFHYISTISVLNESYIPNYDYFIFTEDDKADNLAEHANIYIRTKYEGENVVIKYREKGINSNIYRVGNLAFMLENSKAQENIEDNAFFTRLSCLIDLQIVAPEISLEEISPTDLTAKAIINLFDKKITFNQTFHVFNPLLCNLANILPTETDWGINIVDINKFIKIIITNLDNPRFQKTIERYLLHKGWLNEHYAGKTYTHIMQDRTNHLLTQFGFIWPTISKEAIVSYLKMEIADGKKS